MKGIFDPVLNMNCIVSYTKYHNITYKGLSLVSNEKMELCLYMLTHHARINVPLSSAQLPTFFQQPLNFVA